MEGRATIDFVHQLGEVQERPAPQESKRRLAITRVRLVAGRGDRPPWLDSGVYGLHETYALQLLEPWQISSH